MPSNRTLINAALAGLLVFGLTAAALPAVPAYAVSTDTDAAAAASADGTTAGPVTTSDPTISVTRDGVAVTYPSLEEAVDAASDGETIDIAGQVVLSRPIAITGKSITLRATAPARIIRADGYPLSGGKPDALARIGAGGALTAETTTGAADSLVFDGAGTDSQEALVRIDGSGASFVQRAGVSVLRGLATAKPWAGVYVRNGAYTLDGGDIRDCRAYRNAAVAVERAGAMTMTGGGITGNHNTATGSSVWISGRLTMTGGRIAANGSDSSSGGMIEVLSDGVLDFRDGVIGDTATSNLCAVFGDGNASLRMGGDARISGDDAIRLGRNATLVVTAALAHHGRSAPLAVILDGSLDAGRTVAVVESGVDVEAVRETLHVRSGANSEALAVMADPDAPNRIVLPVGDVADLLALLDAPYADDLGLELKPELLAEGAFDDLRDRLDDFHGGQDTPAGREHHARLDHLERQRTYLEREREAVDDSIITLSRLGSANADRERTQHQYRFDNLDITGYYLSPGERRFNLYLEAADPSAVRLAWRQVGMTDGDSFSSLHIRERAGLRNGENRITLDLSGATYGHMLFLINESADNPARARFEGADANEDGTPAVTGTQLGSHPFYVHDAADPGRFWDFVRALRDHAARVRSGDAEDMTMLQMGDGGHLQLSMRATLLADIVDQEGLTDERAATEYAERSNAAIQEWLSFHWAYEGFDETAQDGPNTPSPMRVHISFTKTVKRPSDMYAYTRYFHMPEDTVRGFLNGTGMYGWGMSHEYGHMLDNTLIKVNEETNNLYSLAGMRHAGIMTMGDGGFSTDVYHSGMRAAAARWDERLARIASEPGFAYDWNEGGEWGSYIWTHLMSWWNGLQYFDGWDYVDYDYGRSPYTPERAAEVREWGAFGAMLRMLRGEPDAVATITGLTADLNNDGQHTQQYNRLAVAATMAIGYDFAAYLAFMGQPDLSPAVREFCAGYPDMPRKVAYHSIDVDAAAINGARPFAGDVTPEVEVREGDGGTFAVTASLPGDAADAYVAAWELYHDGELVGFSRTPSFEYAGDGDARPEGFGVVAYDVRLNPSRAGGAELPDGDGTPDAEETPDTDGTPDGDGDADGEIPDDGTSDGDGSGEDAPGGDGSVEDGPDTGLPDGDAPGDGEPDEAPGDGDADDEVAGDDVPGDGTPDGDGSGEDAPGTDGGDVVPDDGTGPGTDEESPDGGTDGGGDVPGDGGATPDDGGDGNGSDGGEPPADGPSTDDPTVDDVPDDGVQGDDTVGGDVPGSGPTDDDPTDDDPTDDDPAVGGPAVGGPADDGSAGDDPADGGSGAGAGSASDDGTAGGWLASTGAAMAWAAGAVVLCAAAGVAIALWRGSPRRGERR